MIDAQGEIKAQSQRIIGTEEMTITVKLTPEELDLLTALASDQLFRRQYIDPRLPGYKSNPAEVRIGKELVERLRQMSDRAKGTPMPKRNGAIA
jgi:hypothetical protein